MKNLKDFYVSKYPVPEHIIRLTDDERQLLKEVRGILIKESDRNGDQLTDKAKDRLALLEFNPEELANMLKELKTLCSAVGKKLV